VAGGPGGVACQQPGGGVLDTILILRVEEGSDKFASVRARACL
jgi:hypothetical protein